MSGMLIFLIVVILLVITHFVILKYKPTLFDGFKSKTIEHFAKVKTSTIPKVQDPTDKTFDEITGLKEKLVTSNNVTLRS